MIEEIKDDSEDTRPKLIPTEYDKKWGKTGTIGHIVREKSLAASALMAQLGEVLKKEDAALQSAKDKIASLPAPHITRKEHDKRYEESRKQEDAIYNRNLTNWPAKTARIKEKVKDGLIFDTHSGPVNLRNPTNSPNYKRLNKAEKKALKKARHNKEV